MDKIIFFSQIFFQNHWFWTFAKKWISGFL